MPRAAVSDTQCRPDPFVGSITRTSNVTYSGALQLDAYRPGTLTGRPCIVLLHGGGWQAGTKADASMVATARVFCQLGFVVFSVDYSLAPAGNRTANYRQPPITDALAAVTWARSNAATYGGDTAQVAALGESAGGHLALMAGIQGTAGANRPDAVVAWSAPTKLDSLTGQGMTPYAEDYIGNVTPSGVEWDTFSPADQIGAGDPPIRIVNSASEDPATGGIAQSQADTMHTNALAAGVDSTKRILAGTVHATFRSADAAGTAAWLRLKLGSWATVGSRSSAPARASAPTRTAA